MRLNELTKAAIVATVTAVLDHENSEITWDDVLAQAVEAQQLLDEERQRQAAGPRYAGDVYNPGRDAPRLDNQLYRIFNLMTDGKYRTVRRISQLLSIRENSVQAQIRNLRKAPHGDWKTPKRNDIGRGNGRDSQGKRRGNVWYYQLRNPDGSAMPPRHDARPRN